MQSVFFCIKAAVEFYVYCNASLSNRETGTEVSPAMLCRLNMQRLLRRNKHTITLPLKLIKELQQRVRYILFSVFLFFIVYDCKQLGLLDSLVCVRGVCVTHHNSLTVSVGCSIGSNGRLEYSPKSERNQGRTLARFQYQCPCALCVSLLVSMARFYYTEDCEHKGSVKRGVHH